MPLYRKQKSPPYKRDAQTRIIISSTCRKTKQRKQHSPSSLAAPSDLPGLPINHFMTEAPLQWERLDFLD